MWCSSIFRSRCLLRLAFDLIAHWTKRGDLTDAAYYNLLVAAISTLPVLVTGILAWQYQLDGQKLKGILLLHLILACVSSVMIWLVWWVNFRRSEGTRLNSSHLVISYAVFCLKKKKM